MLCGGLWRELEFDWWQGPNAKERRFVGRHNLETLAILPSQHDLFYQGVEPVWVVKKSFYSLRNPTLVAFLYMPDQAQLVTDMERYFVLTVAEVEYHTGSLGTFLRGTR